MHYNVIIYPLIFKHYQHLLLAYDLFKHLRYLINKENNLNQISFKMLYYDQQKYRLLQALIILIYFQFSIQNLKSNTSLLLLIIFLNSFFLQFIIL